MKEENNTQSVNVDGTDKAGHIQQQNEMCIRDRREKRAATVCTAQIGSLAIRCLKA